ncbi:unnamed protein product [Bemisia tabaci]|uniref:Uncharacterized protein n=2 Tax=Bemisia tabaci TaxID=7038 RepID=A0A9P0CFE8_BEMTA|nr:unnamed protein product [Bemisia tabaci]
MKRDVQQHVDMTEFGAKNLNGNASSSGITSNANESYIQQESVFGPNQGATNNNLSKAESEIDKTPKVKDVFNTATRRCKKLGPGQNNSKCLLIRSKIRTFEPLDTSSRGALEGRSVDNFSKRSGKDASQFAIFNGEKIVLKPAPKNHQDRFNYFLEPHYNKEKTHLDSSSNQFDAEKQRFRAEQNPDVFSQEFFSNHQTENSVRTKMTSSSDEEDGRHFSEQASSDESGVNEQQLNDTIWNNVRDNIFSSLRQLSSNRTESAPDEVFSSHELCNFQDYIFSSSPNCTFGQLIYNLVEESSFVLQNQNFSERNLLDTMPDTNFISGRRKASLKYITFLLGVLVVKLLIVLPLVILTAGKSIALSLLSLGVATANVFQNKNNLPYMKRRDEVSPFAYDKFSLGPHSFR